MEFLLNISMSLFKHSGYVVSPAKNVETLMTEMDQLKSKREDVMRAVETAERQPMMRRKNEVNHWLVRAEMLEGEVAKMDEELKSKQSIPWFRLWSRYKLSKVAIERLEEACDLNAKGNFGEVADLRPLSIEEMPCPEFTVGLGALLEQLHSLVQTTGVGIIGLYGMGGVGKTTLLNKFNNELRSVDHGFDMVISIKVSENPNLEKMQKMISSRSGLPWQESDGCDERALHIHRALSKVRFLLIFDDLWDPLSLSSIGIPLPNSRNGCKIILATRNMDVCGEMDAQRMVKVECLGWEDACQLFLYKAGEESINSWPIIRSHAAEIVGKCGGLPLALTAVGRAMATKRTPQEWTHAIRSLHNAPAEINGMESVLYCLKRSYDDLHSDNHRSSFLYCTLVSEKYGCEEEIIRYWIAEDMIGEFDSYEEAYERGLDIIGRLRRASLLESPDDELAKNVKMHGMIRTMALWVASECGKVKNKWLVQVGQGLRVVRGLHKWVGAERISLSDNGISSICTGDKQLPRLMSLMLNNNVPLRSLSSDLFSSLRWLRLLSLSNTSIEELPTEVAMLTELQCLDLSWTKLKSLPRELGNLLKLRYLELSYTRNLVSIPAGVIGGLSGSLQVLGMAFSYDDWKVGEAGDGVDLEELEGLKQLRQLDITVVTREALRVLSHSARLAQSARTLVLGGLLDMTVVRLPSDLGPLAENLRSLWIVRSVNLEQIAIDNGMWPSLLNLENLILSGLIRAEIKWEGVLPHGFPDRLVKLVLIECSGIQRLIGEEIEEEGEGEAGVAMSVFPMLRFLCVGKLSELTSICPSNLALPSLQILQVYECPKLKRLPFGPHSGKKLEEIRGETQWWEELEWDDDAVKSAFLPRFRRLVGGLNLRPWYFS